MNLKCKRKKLSWNYMCVTFKQRSNLHWKIIKADKLNHQREHTNNIQMHLLRKLYLGNTFRNYCIHLLLLYYHVVLNKILFFEISRKTGIILRKRKKKNMRVKILAIIILSGFFYQYCKHRNNFLINSNIHNWWVNEFFQLIFYSSISFYVVLLHHCLTFGWSLVPDVTVNPLHLFRPVLISNTMFISVSRITFV